MTKSRIVSYLSPSKIIKYLFKLALFTKLFFLAGFAVWSTELPEYTSSTMCAQCHDDQKVLWEVSDHSWAWLPANDETVLGDFDDTKFIHHNIETRFFKEDDRFWIETADETGALKSYVIEYVVGVRPLQQYLIAQPGGRLQALDIAWDVDKKAWFMVFPDQTDNVPGNALHWTGVYKNWNGACAECHATDYKKNYDIQTRSFLSTWSEPGVTCEACHGPGQAHVKWAQTPDLFELIEYLGINEKGLVSTAGTTQQEQELNMCAGCHSRRSALSDGSPHAGTQFADNYELALLRPNLYHQDGQIKDEVYVYGSFLQSKMFGKGVTCTDCHNPHSGRIKASDNTLCTQCHSPAGNQRFMSLQKKKYDTPDHHFHPESSDGAQCVSCHMPETTFMQVDPRRDHRFGVPNPTESAAIGSPNACTSCHEDKNNTWAQDVLKSQFPNSTRNEIEFAKVFARLPDLESIGDLLEIAENQQYPAIIRATAISRLIPYQSQLPWTSLVPFLKEENQLIRSAAARVFQSAPKALAMEHLLPLLEDELKTVRVAATRSLLSIPVQSFSAKQRVLFSPALAEYHASLIANADHPTTQMALVGLALTFRNIPAAKAAIVEALATDSQLPSAWIMKANLESAEKRPELVEKTLLQAQAAMPNSAVIFQFSGNYLAGQRQYERAIKALEKAVSLSEGSSVVATDYVAVLSQAGDFVKALAVVNEFLIEQPEDVTLLFLKANAQLETGLIEQSRKTVQRLLELDPGYPLPEVMRQ